MGNVSFTKRVERWLNAQPATAVKNRGFRMSCALALAASLALADSYALPRARPTMSA
jgi:hypothetical protein